MKRQITKYRLHRFVSIMKTSQINAPVDVVTEEGVLLGSFSTFPFLSFDDKEARGLLSALLVAADDAPFPREGKDVVVDFLTGDRADMFESSSSVVNVS